jgi:hypothetical protein
MLINTFKNKFLFQKAVIQLCVFVRFDCHMSADYLNRKKSVDDSFEFFSVFLNYKNCFQKYISALLHSLLFPILNT